ncbi:S24/S26 family peptidase [uncultured Ruminococcus sp.]|uniref:S24/S26 family peptidase n=1 Tax=uncultured Ruminococcus sp. TaxID=165186 RepID=UPI0025F1CAEC|nr:S24/S26 family peptidase [uncultured Ruminococcus sp.]
MTYEEYLEKNDDLTYTNVGVSMMPLLHQGRDLFTVTKKTARRCKAGDVVLYRRPPNKYVLHRIIAVRPHDYVILGDNCVRKEYGIKDSDIIGIMTGFVRNGRSYSVKDLPYRLYSAYIMSTIPIRIFRKKAVLKAKRTVKKIIRI